MSEYWLIVPTLGNRESSLQPLLAEARRADIRTVVIRTDNGWDGEPHPGADITLHSDRMNIQHWWNLGIKAAQEEGCSAVVIANDDISATSSSLRELVDAIGYHDVDIAYPFDPVHASVRVTPITGYCFALNPGEVLPDDRFQWWWGEHDIELRASRILMMRHLNIKHLRTPGDGSYDRPVRHLIEMDREHFRWKYPELKGVVL